MRGVVVQDIRLDKIKIENRIRKDYGDIKELAESIKQLGLLEPIVVTLDNLLLAGERRLKAVSLLGWQTIPCVIRSVKDEEEQLLCEIAENEKRKNFTPSERVAYGLKLEVIEKLKARERMESGKKHTLSSIEDRVENSRGIKTDDVVGKKIGMSGTGYYRAKKVIESGNKEVIEQMDSGKIGIATAYEKIKKEDCKKVINLPDKQETKKEGGIKKESPVELTDEKESLPISLRHIELLVNNFLAIAENYSRMIMYIPKLSKQEKKEIINEVHQIVEWHDEFVKLLKS